MASCAMRTSGCPRRCRDAASATATGSSAPLSVPGTAPAFRRHAGWRSKGRRALAAAALGLALAAGCRASNHQPPIGAAQVPVAPNEAPAFAVGVAPTVAPPVAAGSLIGFRLSSSETGYGHLYLINADAGVTMLAENLPLAAGAQVDWPRPGDGIQLRASPPAGIDRLILLVTRQPFAGFANNQGNTLTRPVSLAVTAEAFLRDFNRATRRLPAAGWAVAETRVQVIE